MRSLVVPIQAASDLISFACLPRSVCLAQSPDGCRSPHQDDPLVCHFPAALQYPQGNQLMAKRTNRVVWGLAAVLAAFLLIGAVVGLQHTRGTIQVAGIRAYFVKFDYWRVGFGVRRASHSNLMMGYYMDLGPVKVVW
jgi:hypothetical protein